MTSEERTKRKAVLITGAAGYVGRLVTEQLSRDRRGIETIVATDLRAVPEAEREPGVIYEAADITTGAVADLIGKHRIDTVVHLAAIVTPPGEGGRELAYRVDVEGTERLLEACVEHAVCKIIVTSSGAAYGYHADNPPLLREDDALRGNEIFAYAHHKRLVEQLLERYRQDHPALGQLIFRPGTVIGERTHNQITAIFERPVVLGLKESDTPFVFIWDRDVAACIVAGVHGMQTGIFNMAGEGVMTLREIARAMGKPFVSLPARVVERGLAALERHGLAPYGPEQVCFLLYRPVLSGERLIETFGFRPKSSREAFETYRASHA